MDSGRTSSAPAYAPEKILTVKFPHVVPGSVIEYKLEVKHKNMPFFYDTFTFASKNDILLKEVILKNIPRSFRCSTLPQSLEVTEKGNEHFLCAGNLQNLSKSQGFDFLCFFRRCRRCSLLPDR